MSGKPILCLDFDGVLHAYTSGWQGVDVIPDGPVPGATAFLSDAVTRFLVVIYSSRSKEDAGIRAMQRALQSWLIDDYGISLGRTVCKALTFAHEKPAAFLTIDDRAICFDGTFPKVDALLAFKPWNKKET